MLTKNAIMDITKIVDSVCSCQLGDGITTDWVQFYQMTPYSSSIHNFSSEQGNTAMFNIDYSLFSISLCSL